jgi:glycerophosphoryl diester phosphodiesterase
MVIAPDGSFWISDEFGPWLLHFARDGELLGAPHELPDGLRSPQHPLVLSGAAIATVAASRGGEGLAASADGRSLWFALESPLAADMTAANGDDDSVVRFVRVYRYDLASGSFSPNYLRLPLAPGTTAIGEVALQSGDRYLVVERDDGFGATAKHKRVRRLRWNGNSAIDEGVVANLLDIADPARIAAQTDAAGTYRMPYFTIEAVHAIDATTILVVNDNNYPATGARGSDIKDSTEWAWIALPALASPKPRVRP